jgi:ribonuclease VapC
MAEVVLDSSAVLAAFHGEPGAEATRLAAPGALMSVVNHAEVLCHLADHGVPIAEAVYAAGRLGYLIVPADAQAAVTVAMLHDGARRRGLSQGDKFCLALARDANLPVLTTDRAWAEVDLGVEVRLIR